MEMLLAAQVIKAVWAVAGEVDGFTYPIRGTRQTTVELLGQKTFLGVWKWMEEDSSWMVTVTINGVEHIELLLGKEFWD